MATARDEENRASAYIASNKPLFQARKIERKFFTRSRVSRDEQPVGQEESPASRIPLPRKTSSPRATASLRHAYEQALREEEISILPETDRDRDVGAQGSPSPAPRVRPVGRSLREKDEARMEKLREGMLLSRSSPQRQNSAEEPVSPLEEEDIVRLGRSGGFGVDTEEESTDDYTNKLKQHARDQQRLNVAVNSANPLFTRAGLGTRVTETAHTLVRKTSASSMESEPAVRLPRTWGKNAKKNPGWLNRIVSPDSTGEIYGLSQQSPAESSIDWARVAADTPLPSLEDASSVQEPTPPHSRPNSAQPRNTSPQKSHIWDPELDFTAQSVQESTSPQLKIRNTKLDEIRAREIESLSKRAVATARLEEIKERNSQERSVSQNVETKMVRVMNEKGLSENAEDWVVRQLRSASDAEDSSKPEERDQNVKADVIAKKKDIQKTETAVKDVAQELPAPSNGDTVLDAALSSTKDSDVKAPLVGDSYLQGYAGEKTILEEEGEVIPGTPITIFKAPAAVKEKKLSQLGHSRDDSWENLRKLARLTSATPSPASDRLADRSSNESLKQSNRLSADTKRMSGASTPPKSDADPEERIVSEVSLFELQDDKPERISLRTPSPAQDGNIDETPRPKADPLSLPTPIVSGAYIDTPAPRGRQPKISRPPSPPLASGDALHDEVSRLCIKDFIRGSSSHSTTSQRGASAVQRSTEHKTSRFSSKSATQSPKPNHGRRSQRPLFNSANPASVEDDLRAIQHEMDDSTLDDFDVLLLADEENLDLNSTTIMDPPLDLEKDQKGRPLSKEERDRRQELLAIERMNKTIKSGLVSIRDAKRGIERLEGQVSSVPEPVKHNHSLRTCPKCASEISGSTYYHLSVPVPRLWSRDTTKRTGITFTWLGLLLTLLTAWLVLESTACEMICHPKYARTNDWRPDDPFWGWALPTLMDRCIGGLLSFSLRILARLLVWVLSSWTAVLRSWTGALDDGRRGGSSAVGTAPPGAAGWAEGSMFEDEAL